MNIDVTSLLIGLVVGFVFGAVLISRSVHKLGLKLDAIGTNLQIENYPKSPEQSSRLGFFNDIKWLFGSDVKIDQSHSSVDNSRTANVSNKKIVVGKQNIIERLRYSFKAQDESPDFKRKLDEVWKADDHFSSSEWYPKWVDLCLDNPKIRTEYDRQLRNRESEGWRIAAVEYDNHGPGLHCNVFIERDYAQKSVARRA
jgi:hypothetical protein